MDISSLNKRVNNRINKDILLKDGSRDKNYQKLKKNPIEKIKTNLLVVVGEEEEQQQNYQKKQQREQQKKKKQEREQKIINLDKRFLLNDKLNPTQFYNLLFNNPEINSTEKFNLVNLKLTNYNLNSTPTKDQLNGLVEERGKFTFLLNGSVEKIIRNYFDDQSWQIIIKQFNQINNYDKNNIETISIKVKIILIIPYRIITTSSCSDSINFNLLDFEKEQQLMIDAVIRASTKALSYVLSEINQLYK